MTETLLVPPPRGGRTGAAPHDARVPRDGAARRRTAPAVFKFGGAALASGGAIAHAAQLVARRAPAPTVVVASALAGVTDALLAVAADAVATPVAALHADVAALRDRHLRAIVLLRDGAGVHDAIVAACADLEALLGAIHCRRRLDAATADVVVARGERLAARILAAALDDAGVPAVVVDGAEVVHADARHGDATPDLAATADAARTRLAPLLDRGIVPVVPGFIARGAGGDLVTLGRGGSDLTATLLARALGAREAVLWKDVPGILTGDPRVVADARVVPRLDAAEAAALAHYGARVLHPRAIAPVPRRLRVRVRPFAAPDAGGTVVTAPRARDAHRPDRRAGGRVAAKAIAATAEQAVVSVAWRGFLHAHDVSARAAAAVQRAGVGASVAAQGWSDHAVRLTVPASAAAAMVAALDAEFAADRARGDVAEIAARTGVVTLGIVGAGVPRDAAVATRVFGALAGSGIAVVASGHGPGDAALSVVVDAERAGDAQRALHHALRLGTDAAARPVAAVRAGARSSPRRARTAASRVGLSPAFELSGPSDAPLVVALGGISASRHVVATADDPSPGWWEAVVGPGRAIDTRRHRVLGLDFLDGGRAADGRPARTVTTHDQADALAAALDAIGAARIHTLVGASYGGMVALAFAERYPDRVERLVVLSAAHESHPMSTGLRALQRRIVALGLATGSVGDALALARGVAMTTYRTAREFGERFAPTPGAAPTGDDAAPFAVERYLDHAGRRFAAAFPAERFLALSLSADLHRVDPAAIRTPTVVVAAEGDTLVPESQLVELVARLGGPARLVRVPTRYGHDAFLTEPTKIGRILAAVLRGGTPEPRA